MRRLAALAASLLAGLLVAEGAYRAVLSWRARGAGSFELYAIGESSTFGQPYGPDLAFPRLVSLMFEERLQGRPIAVKNLGRPGDTIYPQSIELIRALKTRDRRNPAAVLIYSGHNESFAPPSGVSLGDRLYAAFKRAVVYRSLLLSDLFCRLERRLDYRGGRDFAAFDYHTRRAIEAALAADALPVPATVIGNERGVEPNASCLGHCGPEALTDEPALRDFAAARKLEAAGKYADAAALYRRAVDEDPATRFGRAKTETNDYRRSLAREYGIPLVDAVALFEARSPHGAVGDELMSDGHHPNLDGYLLLAAGFADALSSKLGERVRRRLTAAQALDEADYGPSRQAEALTESGVWLLFVSLDHPGPALRLAAARKRFEAALRLDRSRWAPWLGLAVAEAAQKNGKLPDPDFGDAVRAMVFPDGCPAAAQLDGYASQLRAAGARATTLKGLADAGNHCAAPALAGR